MRPARAALPLFLGIALSLLLGPAACKSSHHGAAPPAAGDLVPSFGSQGAVLGEAADGEPTAMAVEGDSLYLAGSTSQGWRIEKRRTSDAGLVAEFGAGGVVTSAVGQPHALLTEGGFLYAGGSQGRKWIIEKRLLTDGSFDAGFGDQGVVAVEIGSAGSIVHALAVDGEFLFAAGVEDWVPGFNQPLHMRIEKRRLTDGSFDAGFGDAGVVEDVGEADSLAVAGGWLIVGGEDNAPPIAGAPTLTPPGYGTWLLEKRSAADGSLDTSFGVGGRVLDGKGEGYGALFSVAVNADRIITAGSIQVYMQLHELGMTTGLAARSVADGSLQEQFGGSGEVQPGRSGRSTYPAAQIVSGDSIYFFGCDARYRVFFAPGDTEVGPYWMVQKRRVSDGAADPTFAGGGIVIEKGFLGSGRAMALDAESLYLAGVQDEGGASRWRIEKRLR